MCMRFCACLNSHPIRWNCVFCEHIFIPLDATTKCHKRRKKEKCHMQTNKQNETLTRYDNKQGKSKQSKATNESREKKKQQLGIYNAIPIIYTYCSHFPCKTLPFISSVRVSPCNDTVLTRCVYTIGFIHSVLMRTAFQFMSAVSTPKYTIYIL